MLVYKVKWGFVRLGTIAVRQQCEDPELPSYVRVCIGGESAAGIPFVDVFFRSTSMLDTTAPTNVLYELATGRDEHQRTTYMYDHVNRRMIAVGTQLGDVTRLDTVDAPVPYYDGTGLYMLTRCAAGSDTTLLLPTVMDFAFGHTSIRFTDRVEEISVAAFSEDVPGYHFLGTTDWKGEAFAGMSGAFEGWVSIDPARVILKASVSIFLGSVTIELESMDRP